jgi:acyl CoA:acetate/3-ketoacid CoA transferase alpha subunit
MKSVSVQDAVAMIPDGAILMIGGFMAVGTPERLIDELVRQGKRRSTSSRRARSSSAFVPAVLDSAEY